MSRSERSDRPNLEQKKKLARELLRGVRALDTRAALRFTWTTKRFRGKGARDVLAADVKLADAQHVIAAESGFDSWPRMVDYVQRLERDPDGAEAAFERAVHAVIRGRTDGLRVLLDAHPDLATARSPRSHRCVLLHYVAANGVENEHQVVPPNAVEIAEVLFARGAGEVADATAPIYGGGGGSTPLVALVTSGHPAEVGVQADLVRVFCENGASPDGIDDDSLPLHSALGFRHVPAARALVAAGARVDDLPSAAALGRLDDVREMLDGGRPSRAAAFHNPTLELPESRAPHPAATLEQALVFACMGGERAVAELLLDRGVDVNGGRHGVTALHEACFQGDRETAMFLLERGADPTRRDDNWNSTPIEWAHEAGHPALADALRPGGS